MQPCFLDSRVAAQPPNVRLQRGLSTSTLGTEADAWCQTIYMGGGGSSSFVAAAFAGGGGPDGPSLGYR